MTTTTENIRQANAPRTASGISKAIGEKRDRQQLKLAAEAELRSRIAALSERSARAVADDEDPKPLRHERREAEEEALELRGGIEKLEDDIAALERDLKAAQTREAANEDERASAALKAAFADADKQICNFLVEVYTPIYNRNREAGRAANQALVASQIARGELPSGDAIGRAWAELRQAQEGTASLQRFLLEIRAYGIERGLIKRGA